MEFTCCPLYSGSSGNALYCGYGDTHVLVDAGLPGRTITAALQSIGVHPGSINAILVTHEHSDHIQGVGVLARQLKAPVYANAATWDAMMPKLGNLSAAQVREFETGEDFYIGDMEILPFTTPHDSAGSVGYLLESHGRTLGIATDIGHMNEHIFSHLRLADIVLLESNHDLQMLQSCAYPSYLKRRIRGARGHLSNEDCAKTLVRLCELGLRKAILGHLSDQANTPALALEANLTALAEAGIEGVDVQVAPRQGIGQLCKVL